jgi:hypothetical protein
LSHVDLIDIEIKSIKALAKAATNLGGAFHENKKTFGWFGRSVGDHPLPKGFTVADMGKCDHAISFPNCKYEIGVVKDRENEANFQLLGDFWFSGGLKKQIGEGGWKLKQQYTIEQTIETSVKSRKRYQIEEMPDRQRIQVFLN